MNLIDAAKGYLFETKCRIIRIGKATQNETIEYEGLIENIPLKYAYCEIFSLTVKDDYLEIRGKFWVYQNHYEKI